MKHAASFGAVVCSLLVQGCSAKQPADESRLAAAQTVNHSEGRLVKLLLDSPDRWVIVGVKFPKSSVPRAEDDTMRRLSFLDAFRYRDACEIEVRGPDQASKLSIVWEYSGGTHKVLVADRTFDLPEGKLAVLSYGEQMNPLCELRDSTLESVEQLERELGYQPPPPGIIQLPGGSH